MFTEKQIERTLDKLKRFENTLEPMIFRTVARIDKVRFFETKERFYEIPEACLTEEISAGEIWGSEEAFGWFRTEFTVPEELDGKTLFLKPHTEGYETLLWVNGKPFGTYATKIVFTGHGNHYCDMIALNAKAGEKIEIALEVYTGHAAV